MKIYQRLVFILGFATNNDLIKRFNLLDPEPVDPQIICLCKSGYYGLDLNTVLRQWKYSLTDSSLVTERSVMREYLTKILPVNVISVMEGFNNEG